MAVRMAESSQKELKRKLSRVVRILEDRYGPVPEAVRNLLDYSALKTLAEKLRIETVDRRQGFANIKFHRETKVNPDKLASHQIGINEVADALRNWNVNLPVGTLWGQNRMLTLQANGQLMDADAKGPKVRGKVMVFNEKTWNTPALAGKQLFLRNQSEMACLELP